MKYMKKFKIIVCILLAVASVFTVVAFGMEADAKKEKAFFAAITAYEPTTIKTITTLATKEDGNFNGEYVTTRDENGYVFEYSQDRYATVEDEASSYKYTDEGKFYFRNGKYSEDGETWTTAKPAVGETYDFKLNLDEKNFTSYKFSGDKRILTARFNSSKAEEILGIKLDGVKNNDVRLVVTTNSVYLTMIQISFAKDIGNVVITTSYSYSESDVAK